MDDTACEVRKPAITKIITIGNTMYTVNVFYDGKESLVNILKRLIIRDLKRSEV